MENGEGGVPKRRSEEESGLTSLLLISTSVSVYSQLG